MKYIKYILFSCFVFLLSVINIRANEIYSIDVYAQLNEDGSATIREIWNMKVDKGTEVYKSMYNLGNSEITNFSVMDGTGKVYTSLSSWNVNGTLDSKAYKNGINYVNDGLELCWGMGEYGNNVYILSYDVSNIIYNVDDAQVLYWQFIGDKMNPAPESFNIEVSGPSKYEDTLDVWGYGYEGYAYVYDGLIYMSNAENKKFKSGDYAVLLVKYPLGTFDTTNSYSKYRTFDDFYNMAQDGASNWQKDENTFTKILKGIGTFILVIIQIALYIIPIFLVGKNATSVAKYNKKNINNSEINNFRDIPCKKDVFKAFFLSEVYNLNKKKEDLLGAILLKWLKEKQIKIIKINKKKLFKTKEVTAIDLNTKFTSNNKNEQSLYQMMFDASEDGILEENELKKWCSNNYSKFFKWFDNVINSVKKEYIKSGNITETKEGKVFKKIIYTIDDKLHEDAIKLAGLKKFLKEFSRINEKQPIEVTMWEDYLIFAQIFGIADEVAKQFQKLYPEVFEKGNYNIDYLDICWINSITSNSINSASSARSRAQSYSSGGGGFSSRGGGGGSFGGGGGGCR